MNKILFILPRDGSTPIGGFKMVYEYANRFSKDGYLVELVYAGYIKRLNSNFFIEFLRFIKSFIKYIIKVVTQGYKCTKWFNLHFKIKEKYILNLSKLKYGCNDIIVATAATTVPYVNNFYIDKTHKYYFIQGFENWAGAKETDLIKTYKSGLNLITISKWLHNKLKCLGLESKTIYNGYNFEDFYCKISPERRDPNKILTLYHPSPNKGCIDVIKSLEIVRIKYKGIKLTMFGATKPNFQLPNWINFKLCPTKTELLNLYNENAVFVGASINEGWGLTIGEAMLCGCAVVCTDNKGYLEMAVELRNALVSPVNNYNALAENIIKIIDDENLRNKLALHGIEDMQRFDIEKSYLFLKRLIIEKC